MALVLLALLQTTCTCTPWNGVGLVTPSRSECSGEINPVYGGFSEGTIAGEVTENAAIIWARTNSEHPVMIRFGERIDDMSGESEFILPDRDFDTTFQYEITGLKPDTLYAYQVMILPGPCAILSPVAYFKTAPLPITDQPVTFGYSGDVLADDGPIFHAIQSHYFDFYINIGDWPYADVGYAAETLEQYWAKHREARDHEDIQGMIRNQALFYIWDDHDVINDWDGNDTENTPDKVKAGIQAAHDYFPYRYTNDDDVYRKFRYGKGLELFILDTRRYRDANAIVKTDPDKTMLGQTQLDWFLDALAASTAEFKIVVSSVPLIHAKTGRDYWEGYVTEREKILDFIIGNEISGVVFITTDQHLMSINHYPSGIYEYQAGPLTAEVREQDGIPAPDYVRAEAWVKNFAQVDYTPATSEAAARLQLTYFDENNAEIYSGGLNAGLGKVSLEIEGTQSGRWIMTGDHYYEGTGNHSFDYVSPGAYTLTFSDTETDSAPAPIDFEIKHGEELTISATYISK